MYKTVRISERAYKAIEALSEALNCTFLEATDAITYCDAEALRALAKSNLEQVRGSRAKEKVLRARERAIAKAKLIEQEELN